MGIALLSSFIFSDIKEYQKVLRESPKIPFDHQKQPLQGVLKSKSIGSPINPFYYVENLQ